MSVRGSMSVTGVSMTTVVSGPGLWLQYCVIIDGGPDFHSSGLSNDLANMKVPVLNQFLLEKPIIISICCTEV